MKTMTGYWRFLQSEVSQLFDAEDNPAFWESALERILYNVESMVAACHVRHPIVVTLGRGSHSAGPHSQIVRTRQLFGYANQSGCVFSSLPTFDWSFRWLWEPEENRWSILSGQPNRRSLTYRITMPERTAIHRQATVHTIWLPGSPENPKEKLTQIYRFEKHASNWNCVDTWEQTDRRRSQFCTA